MLLENDLRVDAPLDKVWDFLQDVPKLAPCLPGAELTDDLGEGRYAGGVKVSMGPVTLRFTGTVAIVEADPVAHRMVLHAAGAEARGRGTAEMTVTATLSPAGAQATALHVHQDLQVSGAAAQYGRGMISDVTSVLMKQFTEAIGASITGGAVVRARSASGLSIGIAAMLMALRRVARRFLGPSTRPA